jgi:hypothetical protein
LESKGVWVWRGHGQQSVDTSAKQCGG